MTPLGGAERMAGGQSRSQVFAAEVPLGHWTVHTAVVRLAVSPRPTLLRAQATSYTARSPADPACGAGSLDPCSTQETGKRRALQ